MNVPSSIREASTTLLLAASICMLAGSAGLLLAHASAVRDVRDAEIPLVAEIPTLERRLSVLTQQVEMAELQASVRLGSQEERIATFVLPEKPDLDRLFAFFDVVRAYLEREGRLADFSDVTVGGAQRAHLEGLDVRPVTLRFSAEGRGLERFATLVRLAGLLSVGDALSGEERALLLAQTEAENPAGVVALEQFLSADLLRYSLDPRSYEEQLLKSFPSTTFLSTFRSVTQSSLLADASQVLGGDIGEDLEREKLWPLPMLNLESVSLERGGVEGWSRVGMEVALYATTVDN